MKPCKEGKQDLRIGIRYNFLIFLFFFLLPKIFPQVPINGFCKYNRFEIDSGFTNLFSLNYNDDSYTDLVLFNPAKKEIESLDGDQSLSFSSPKKSKIPAEISLLHNIVDKNSKVNGYIYSSRKQMKVGLISFAKNGKPNFSNEIKFNSYPEYISVDDIDGNSGPDFLISGKSFDGLSIIKEFNNKLKEVKIARNSVYSFSQFIDISRDGFPDIAAFNLASFNIDLFYNKGNGEFYSVRSIPILENISSLRAFDLDLDSIGDLIISKQNSIEIFYGDNYSSFSVRKEIKTEYSPDKIIIGDFNKDGKMDIAYLDLKSGAFSVLFGKDNRNFYPEVIYFRKKGCTDLIPYYSKFVNGIAVLNEAGSLYLISNFKTVSEATNISLGVTQQGLNYFDHNHDGISDICFIDNSENKLNLIIRNSSGIPSLYYSVPLVSNELKIFPDDSEKNKVTFYCYTEGKKLIESIKIDFINSALNEKKSFYVPNNISNLRVVHNRENQVQLYVAQLENEKLSLTAFNSISENYLNSNYSIASKVVCISKGTDNSPEFYFWQNNKDSLSLCYASFRSKFENPVIKYSSKIKNAYNLLSFTGNFITKNNDANFTIIHTPELNQVLTLSGFSAYSVNRNEINEELTSPGLKQYFVGLLNFRGLDKLFYYSADEGKLKIIDFINKGKNISITTVGDFNFVGDYFIKNMNMKNFHLVFTNVKENCITFKQLK